MKTLSRQEVRKAFNEVVNKYGKPTNGDIYFAAEKVTVKVKEKSESEYRVYGRYSSAKAANEVASDLQNLCGYDVIVEY